MAAFSEKDRPPLTPYPAVLEIATLLEVDGDHEMEGDKPGAISNNAGQKCSNVGDAMLLLGEECSPPGYSSNNGQPRRFGRVDMPLRVEPPSSFNAPPRPVEQTQEEQIKVSR